MKKDKIKKLITKNAKLSGEPKRPLKIKIQPPREATPISAEQASEVDAFIKELSDGQKEATPISAEQASEVDAFIKELNDGRKRSK